jgi:hypothetical protein
MSLNALVSPKELVYSYDGSLLGQRIAQVEPDGQTFEVGLPLFWLPCADDVVADIWYYQVDTGTCQLVPVPPTQNLAPPETLINVTQTIS